MTEKCMFVLFTCQQPHKYFKILTERFHLFFIWLIYICDQSLVKSIHNFTSFFFLSFPVTIEVKSICFLKLKLQWRTQNSEQKFQVKPLFSLCFTNSIYLVFLRCFFFKFTFQFSLMSLFYVMLARAWRVNDNVIQNNFLV